MIWPPPLPTKLAHGLHVRPYRSADADALFEALDDPAVWQHIPWQVPGSSSELDEHLRAKLVDGRVTLVVVQDGRLVGTTSLIPAGDAVEIGATQITRAVWARG